MDQTAEARDDGEEDAFARRLEREGLIVLPDASFAPGPFALSPAERSLLDPAHGDGRAKNISLGAEGLRGARADTAVRARLEALLLRYGAWARETLVALAPRYAPFLEVGRTSLRNRAVDAPAASPRKDDRRLHVDAFASQPTGGRRILRVFTNISPDGEPRRWRVGESFEDHARRWARHGRRPLPLEADLLQTLGITRGRRAPYDFLMLAIHDGAKLDLAYQSRAPARDIAFPAGASWIVYTDSVVHAAMAGRHALEQTFYLPLEAMAEPAAAPARILERITGRVLV
jgi:hypothetical protein